VLTYRKCGKAADLYLVDGKRSISLVLSDVGTKSTKQTQQVLILVMTL